MAFLDDLSDTLTKVGHTVVNKAKEMAEIVKINGMIACEKNKINNKYKQIGKLYVERHGADADEGFAEMIDNISASEAKIADYTKQLGGVKSPIRCASCGAVINSDMKFCSACGEAVNNRE